MEEISRKILLQNARQEKEGGFFPWIVLKIMKKPEAMFILN